MKVTVDTFLLVGLVAHLVPVHVEVQPGDSLFTITGLRDSQVRECRVRIRAALQQTKIDMVHLAISVTVDAPAGASGQIDVAAAVGVMVATLKLPSSAVESAIFVGELSLTGAVRPIRGVCALVAAASKIGAAKIVVPWSNQQEAARAARLAGDRVTVSPIESLDELISGTRGVFVGERSKGLRGTSSAVDFSDVRGQHFARRALEVAAVGGHHVLLVGPPGCGATMMSRRLTTILPEMTEDEQVEQTAIVSVAGLIGEHGYVDDRPFRAPHHTVSEAGLVGGGYPIRPGEVTLAHHGVLFIDELHEFRGVVLESLARAVGDVAVNLSRGEEDEKTKVKRTCRVTFPSAPIIVATVPPCPCGLHGVPSTRPCTCPAERIESHWARIRRSKLWPLFDLRINLYVENVVRFQADNEEPIVHGESSATMRARVTKARGIPLPLVVGLDGEARSEALRMVRNIAREHGKEEMDRCVHVARSIARLDGSGVVLASHVAEAMTMRASCPGKDSVKP